MRAVLLTCLMAAFADAALAQTIFKCSDGRSVTYSNTVCDKLGLQLTGEVEDRVTSLPSPPVAPAVGKKSQQANPGKEADLTKGATAKPSNPMLDVLRK